MRAALLATLTLCLSCGGSPCFTVLEPFDADEHESIRWCATYWSSVAREPLVVGAGRWRIIRAQPPAPWVGVTLPANHTVMVAPNLDRATFRSTTCHEMGHTLGLAHIRGPGIMNPTVGALEFSAEDLAECHRVGACE